MIGNLRKNWIRWRGSPKGSDQRYPSGCIDSGLDYPMNCIDTSIATPRNHWLKRRSETSQVGRTKK